MERQDSKSKTTARESTPHLLRQFKETGGGAGVGLAGMRERLRELDGSLEVESDATGTLIRAVVPIPEAIKAKKSGSA
jgi:signal transduction histidine kinase